MVPPMRPARRVSPMRSTEPPSTKAIAMPLTTHSAK